MKKIGLIGGITPESTILYYRILNQLNNNFFYMLLNYLENGEYISFLDSDDEFEIDAIDNFIETIKQTKSDIVVSKFYLRNEKNELITTGGWKSENNIISNRKAIEKMYSNEITFTAWAKLYKSSVIKNSLFPEGLWFEDRPFFLQSLLNSNSISFINKPLLSIYTTKNSITRRLISRKRIVDLQKIWEIELEIATNEKIDNEILRLICTHHISVLYETVIILSLEKNKVNNFGELLTCFDQNISKTKLAFAIHSPSLKVKFKGYFSIVGKYFESEVIAYNSAAAQKNS